MDSDSPPAEPRFGDIAVELGVLTPEQIQQLLERQRHFQEMGLARRVDEMAVEMGLMARMDCELVLNELHQRRQARAQIIAPAPAAQLPGEGPAPVPPCRFGEYDLESRILPCRGLAYQAKDRRTRATVTLRLFPQFLTEDSSWAACFQRDLRVALRLSHPNILKVYRGGEAEGRHYLALEYASGETLADRLAREGRLREVDALHIARDTAYALYHAHVLGLLFRDLRPENILIEASGRARLSDVGVGKVQSDDPRLVACGLAAPDPLYQAPEQVASDVVVGRRSDLYGLGAILFHMLTGHPPFEGEPDEVRRRILHDAPPDPRRFAPELHPLTRAMVVKLLAKNPEDRVKRADGIIVMLDRILGEKSREAGLVVSSRASDVTEGAPTRDEVAAVDEDQGNTGQARPATPPPDE